MEEVTDLRCFWLYALLAKIERPLHDTTAAAMRSLFKYCSNLRASIGNKPRKGWAVDSILPQLNLLIIITGIYFSQDEKMNGIIDIDDLQIG